MELGVLGMGAMGRAMARRLLDQGHTVAVWNRTPGRAAEVTDAGGREVSSPTEAASGAAAVLLSLADDRAVLDVVLEGARGAPLAGALGEAVLVDLSTVSPSTTRRVAGALARGRYVAAPVLGGPQTVLDGLATYLVAGPREAVDGLEPLWEALSPACRRVGEDPGTATTLKIVANYLLLSGLAALAEAVATAQGAGIDDEALRGFLSSLPLVAPGLHNRLDDLIDGDHQGWFAARLGAKDAHLMDDLAASVGLRLPLAGAVEERYRAVVDAGLGDADVGAVIEGLR
jgi:3-hydroxyisobutyrate dehydrogenase-like beta-hydroxyacid dehydrogenase